MNNIIKKENGYQPAVFGSVVDQFFQNNLSRFFDDENWRYSGARTVGNFPVNIRETDKAYEMELYAPGFKKEDFQLDLDGEQITITAQHKQADNSDNSEANKNWMRQEYTKRSVSRSFQIDDTVDAAKISAKYENGVMHLMFPKKDNAQKISRSINIQ